VLVVPAKTKKEMQQRFLPFHRSGIRLKFIIEKLYTTRYIDCDTGGLKGKMQDQKHVYKKIFFALSACAALFVLTEIVLQSFGKSICQTEGCKVVAQHVRFGDISILLIGLVTFSLLAFLSFLEIYLYKAKAGSFINLVLIVSLACEGFFTGYQAFSLHTPCVFCLIILAIMVSLGAIRLLADNKEIVAGFVSLAAVFSMLYLVPPAVSTANLPNNERFILFYSKECKHCAEVIKSLEEKKIEVKHLEVTPYAGFLKSMGIDTVPTLQVIAQNQKLFISGKDSILSYLLACTPPPGDGANKGSSSNAGESTIISPGASGSRLNIFTPSTLLTEPMSSDESGVCKQNEICK
jgi:hypothetical protein